MYKSLIATAVLAFALGAPPTETPHLKIVTSATPESAKAGAKVALAVDVTPKPGMHVYAPGQDGYIAITLTVDPLPAFSATGKAKYPDPEKIVLPAINETQLVYDKPFRITQDITLTPKAGSAPLTIKGTIRYQACNDKICFLPTNVPVTWTVNPAAR